MMDNAPAKIENPYGEITAQAQAGGALAAAEQMRAVAEAIAERQIARQNPRDPRHATDLVLQDCSMPSLAGEATYEYSRGGSEISGPSIRLAETIARRWGNIKCGVKELSRREGFSEVKAYAIDLETGFEDEKTFQVRHWRDRKAGGGYAITDERDIYEMIANQGARRKRACILAVIPQDVVDAAVRQCEVTLKSKIDITPETIKAVLEQFAKYGIHQEHIEKRIQRRLDALTPGLYLQLRRIYNSLKDGMSQPSDWFELGQEAGAVNATAASRTQSVASELANLARKPAAPTAADVRKAIAEAKDAEALTPLLASIMALPAGPERDELGKEWTAATRKFAPAADDAFAEGAKVEHKSEKPAGTDRVYKEIKKKLEQGKPAELDEIADTISLYQWADERGVELLKIYRDRKAA
jgi:hypothetical protein